MFNNNIRAFVPQIAMSAGTMIALSCNEIIMGAHSSLGPIDPQIGQVPAHGVIEEFQQAQNEIASATNDAERFAKIAVWQPIIAKYNPTFIGECQKAISWSTEMVCAWLKTGMFVADPNATQKAERIVASLSSHEQTKTHARHVNFEQLLELGVNVTALETDNALQDAVLAVHHSCVNTLMQTPAVKIIENQTGGSFITMMQFQSIPQPLAQLPLSQLPRAGTPELPPQVTPDRHE